MTPPHRDPPPIRFGTSGWRGILGEEITLPRVDAAAGAVADWVAGRAPGARVWVAHDRRYFGPRLARRAARALAGRGLRVIAAEPAQPTPVLSRTLRRGGAAAAVVFTASHNPPAHHGMKVLDASGSSLLPEQTRWLEARAGELLAAGPGQDAPVRGRMRTQDPVPAYCRDLAAELDGTLLRRSRLAIVYDAMHGAGAGVLDAVLRELGVGVRVLRAGRDPRFEGDPPDPEPERLRALEQAVRQHRTPCLGLATDGDADRFAVLDGEGRALSATQALALLVDHLAQTGRIARGVALSVATGSLVEKVARAHGLAVERHPIAFKYLSESLCQGRADVAGEESGGFAWSPFVCDKDGMLAGALLAEVAAAHGGRLGPRLRALERAHGVSACGRRAVVAGAQQRHALEQLCRATPERVLDAPVREVDRRQGLRLVLDDGFLMLRASGTEGAIRVYAEGPNGRSLEARLRQGMAWLAPGPADGRSGRGRLCSPKCN